MNEENEELKEVGEENRCMSCGDILGSTKLEPLNDGRLVHRACFLSQYKWLKVKGLVGKKEHQMTFKQRDSI